jgi:hypothetical protein
LENDDYSSDDAVTVDEDMLWHYTLYAICMQIIHIFQHYLHEILSHSSTFIDILLTINNIFTL